MAKPQDPYINEPPEGEDNTQPPSDYNPATLLKHKPKPRKKQQVKRPKQVNSQANKVKSQVAQPSHSASSNSVSASSSTTVHSAKSMKTSSQASKKSKKSHKTKQTSRTTKKNNKHNKHKLTRAKKMAQVTNKKKEAKKKELDQKLAKAKKEANKQSKELHRIDKAYKQRRADMIKPPTLNDNMLKNSPINELKQLIADYNKQINKATRVLRPKSQSFARGKMLDGTLLRKENSFIQLPSVDRKDVIQYHKWQNKEQAIQQRKVDFANKINHAIKPRVEKYYQSITIDKANKMISQKIQQGKQTLKKNIPTADVMKYGKAFAQKAKKGQQLKSFQYKEVKAYKAYEHRVQAFKDSIKSYTQSLSNIIKHNAKVKHDKAQKKAQPKMLRHQHEHVRQPTQAEIQEMRHKDIIKAQAKLTDQLRQSEQQDKNNSAIYNAIHGGFLSLSNNWHMKHQAKHNIRHTYIAKRELLDKAYRRGYILDNKYKYTYTYSQFEYAHKALKQRYHIKMSNPQINTEKKLKDYCKKQFYQDNPDMRNLQAYEHDNNWTEQQAKDYRHQQFMNSEEAVPVNNGMKDINNLYNYYQGTALNQTNENEESVNNANQSKRLSNTNTNEQKAGKFNRFLTVAQQRAKFCCKCISTSPAFTRLAKSIGFNNPTIAKKDTKPKQKKPSRSKEHLSWRDKLKNWNQEQHKEEIARNHYGARTAQNLHHIYQAKQEGATYSQYETPQTEVVSKAYKQFMKQPDQKTLNTTPVKNDKTFGHIDSPKKMLKHTNTISKIRDKTRKLHKHIKRRIQPHKMMSRIERRIQQHRNGRQR